MAPCRPPATLLAAFEHELKNAKRGKGNELLVGVDDKGEYQVTDNFDTFIERIHLFLREAEQYVTNQKDWKPQS